MNTLDNLNVCKACGKAGEGKYCADCGQIMAVRRLSLRELLHEAFHYFTHLEHGFVYTLKLLLIAPGKVQKQYVEGNRIKHQKPFSMFFISATVSALIFYWVNTALIKYFHTGDSNEANFFHQYWVLFHVCLFPFYCMITYLCFKKAGYNFGEIAVYQLYTFSFVFLAIALIQLLKFLDHELETRYIEFPLLMAYTIITNLRFFGRLKAGQNILLSIVAIVFIFMLAALVQDEIIKSLYGG
jgi:hypothetical protein